MASNGIPSTNPFGGGSFFRPGLEHLDKKSNSFRDHDDRPDELNTVKKLSGNICLSQGDKLSQGDS
jgi:hypothetical protein